MLAFNALPATFKKDMTAHQYDQQCNQVVCSAAGDHVYVSNEADSNLYGLEPNFGCCTANMHQGWPKFASSLWMRSSDGGLAAIAYAPCVVDTTVAGNFVRVEVTAEYQLSVWRRCGIADCDQGATGCEESLFLHLRMPSWDEGAVCGVWDDAATFERIDDLKPGIVCDLGPGVGCEPAG